MLFKNARLFDGRTFFAERTDLFVENGKVALIEEDIKIPGADEVIDLSGKILSPGLIDLHSHLRDPGQEWREDLHSGSLAGAAGGFTTLVCMPNTDPPVDNAALVRYLVDKGEGSSG
ncbi:MAG TPA: dihydroorotase, partial [Synergistetes bacterium]|nr:dihydroorotase [Synergistota bacterium]